MWSRYRVWSLVFSGSSTQVYGVAIATFLSIQEYKAVGADTFSFNHVVDYGIYAIPATLLLRFVGSAVTGYHYAALRVVTHAGSYAGQQATVVIIQSYAVAGEVSAWQGTQGVYATGIHSWTTVFWAWALTNTIGINRLAYGGGNQFFIAAVRNTITVRIAAHTVRVNRTSRRSLLLVELVGYAVAIAIRQYGLGQTHQARDNPEGSSTTVAPQT
jgi:hypothetical protein